MPKFISWIPTGEEYIDGFFELVHVSPSDVVYDLGSGDGRLLFAALERGAGKCVGIDIDPGVVKAAREIAKSKGLEDRVTFIEGDVMDQDLSGATVVFTYLYTSASVALRPKFENELKPGTRVVVESFSIPGWHPAKTTGIEYRSFYLYVMPPERTSDYDTALTDFPSENDLSYWG
jgi:ubiquinone/menaquinone biosynthesis C-methylase UbiE